MLSIRLNKETEKQLDYASKQLGKSKSDMVRESLIEYLAKIESPSAWEAGKELFGKHKSGVGSLSTASSKDIAQRIQAKKKNG
jgi:predicted DNA-binding protein